MIILAVSYSKKIIILLLTLIYRFIIVKHLTIMFFILTNLVKLIKIPKYSEKKVIFGIITQ